MELILAYIDPGSGSLVIQALVAGLVAIPVIFRNQIRRVVRHWRRGDEPTVESAGQDDSAKGA